jgi:hypothetical protein
MPGNVTFEQAAAVPAAAVTALQGLRDKGRVRPSQEVRVNAGDARTARGAWSQAVVILDDTRHHDAAAVRANHLPALTALGTDLLAAVLRWGPAQPRLLRSPLACGCRELVS